jgi:hypothetical protein
MMILAEDMEWNDRGRLCLKGNAANQLLERLTICVLREHPIFKQVRTLLSDRRNGPIVDRNGRIFLLETHIKRSRLLWIMKLDLNGDRVLHEERTEAINDAQAFYLRVISPDHIYAEAIQHIVPALVFKVFEGTKWRDEEIEELSTMLGVFPIRHKLKDLMKVSQAASKIEMKRFKQNLPPGEFSGLVDMFVGPASSPKMRFVVEKWAELREQELDITPWWKAIFMKVPNRKGKMPFEGHFFQRNGNDAYHQPQPIPQRAWETRRRLYDSDHQSKTPPGWQHNPQWQPKEGMKYAQTKHGKIVEMKRPDPVERYLVSKNQNVLRDEVIGHPQLLAIHLRAVFPSHTTLMAQLECSTLTVI